MAEDKDTSSASTSSNTKKYLALGGAAVGGAAATAVAAPLAISAVGFGATGITAGSWAASFMSLASTSGIGMGAVGALQSAGAAGLAAGSSILLGTAGAAAGGKVASAVMKEEDGEKKTNDFETQVKDTGLDNSKNMINPNDTECNSVSSSNTKKYLALGGAAVGGAAVTAVAAPLAISALGFGATGIAAGSWAASFMSLASTSGIGMGAVGALQSAGAAGLAAGSSILLGTAGAAAGGKVASAVMKEEDGEKRTNTIVTQVKNAGLEDTKNTIKPNDTGCNNVSRLTTIWSHLTFTNRETPDKDKK